MTNKYAKVVIPGLAIDTAFDYELDEEQQRQVIVGQQVYVPFGRKNVYGIVVAVTSKSEIRNLKRVLRIETSLPSVSRDLLHLTRKVADYYYASWGEVLQGCLVPRTVRKKNSIAESCRTVNVELPGLLTDKQSHLLRSLTTHVLQKNPHPLLIWSGTLDIRLRLYLELVEHYRREQKQVLILFPEIELIERYRSLFEQRYGEEVGIVHSQLSSTQRYAIWNHIQQKSKNIILATRLVLFYNFSELALVIVEQEHSAVYKSDQKPMYHAREVALWWGEIRHIPVVVASDTPSVESYYYAQQKKYVVLKVEPETERCSPSVQLVKVSEKDAKKEHLLFTRVLQDAVKERLVRREKVIIFANLKGYAQVVFCRMCGRIRQCPHCELALSLSKQTNTLYCKYCQFQTKFKEECPYCDSHHFTTFGFGTEAIIDRLKIIFPGARIGKIVADTFASQIDLSHYDIIIGTHVLNKIPAYPQVTLLCVLLIDILLNLPDFRSGEKAFQHVYGLAQKIDYSRKNAQVLIQSCNDTHYVVQALCQNKPEIFYQQDISFREELCYPPFGTMVEILVSSKDNKKAEKAAQDISSLFQKEKVTVLGPVPAYRAKLRGQYRRQILLLAKDHDILRQLLHSHLSSKKGSAVRLRIVVDPVELS